MGDDKRILSCTILFLVLGSVAQAKPAAVWNRLMVSATESCRHGDWAEAERLYMAAMQEAPKDDDPRKNVTLRMLADCYMRCNRPQQASYYYSMDLALQERVSKSYPGVVFDLLPLARIARSRKEYSAAEVILNRAIAVCSHYQMETELAEAYEILACAYIDTGKIAAAKRLALELQKECTRRKMVAILTIAYRFYEIPDYESAQQLFEFITNAGAAEIFKTEQANQVTGAASTLAFLYLRKRMIAAMETSLKFGLSFEKKPGITNLAILANAQALLAACRLMQHRRAEAISILRTAINNRLRMDPLIYMNYKVYLVRDQRLLVCLEKLATEKGPSDSAEDERLVAKFFGGITMPP